MSNQHIQKQIEKEFDALWKMDGKTYERVKAFLKTSLESVWKDAEQAGQKEGAFHILNFIEHTMRILHTESIHIDRKWVTLTRKDFEEFLKQTT